MIRFSYIAKKKNYFWAVYKKKSKTSSTVDKFCSRDEKQRHLNSPYATFFGIIFFFQKKYCKKKHCKEKELFLGSI